MKPFIKLLLLLSALQLANKCFCRASKVNPPRKVGSSPDLSPRTLGASSGESPPRVDLLAQIEANKELLTKSVEELKGYLKKIENSVSQTRREGEIILRNTEIILKKYFHTSCDDLSPAVEILPKSPAMERKRGTTDSTWSTIITILPPKAMKPAKVRCETNAAGSDWTVVLDRSSGKEHFNKTYLQYEKGFGDPATEYYIGNEVLHVLTSWKPHRLRVELEDFHGKEAWAEYNHFKIGSPETFYTLFIGGFENRSNTGKEDGFKAHNEMKFSTFDQDNSGRNCATTFGGGGGWWYSTCYNVLGTGTYRPKEGNAYGGISYWPWHDIKQSLKKFKLLIRPLQ